MRESSALKKVVSLLFALVLMIGAMGMADFACAAPATMEEQGFYPDGDGVYYSRVFSGQTLYAGTNGAFVYAAPVTFAAPVSSLSPGQTVLCAGETWEDGTRMWYRFEWTDEGDVVRSGWIPAWQMATAPAVQQPAAPRGGGTTVRSSSPGVRTLVEIRTHSVFVRNQPRGAEFATARYWERYLYLGEQRDDQGRVWYKVQYGDQVGFITSEYCTVIYEAADGIISETDPAAPTPPPPPPPGSGRTLVEVRSHAINVRTGPGLNFDSMGTVHHWERYLYLGEQVDARPVLWYKIQWGAKEGWVSSKYAAVITD